MDFFELAKKRRAAHHFLSDKEVTNTEVEKIMEAVRLTPSGYNAQPWEFIVVRSPETKKAIHEFAFGQQQVLDASALIIVLGDKEIGRHAERIINEWVENGYCTEEEIQTYINSMKKERSDEKRKNMALRNSALAAMTFMYAAEAQGLATCPMMGFSQIKLKELLEVPKDRVITMMIALGHADHNQERKRLPRKEIKEMLYWEKFGEQ